MNELQIHLNTPIEETPAIIFRNQGSVLGIAYTRDPSEKAQLHTDCQTKERLADLTSKLIGYLGIGGIGQYSLENGPVNLLARLDRETRNPTLLEMACDISLHNRNLVKPITTHDNNPETLTKPIIRIFGIDAYFTGPRRTSAAIFTTKIFPGESPSDKEIIEMAETLDSLSLKGEYMEWEEYHFVHASRGFLRHRIFKHPVKFESAPLNDLGRLVKNEDQLIYQLADERIDYTSLLVNP